MWEFDTRVDGPDNRSQLKRRFLAGHPIVKTWYTLTGARMLPRFGNRRTIFETMRSSRNIFSFETKCFVRFDRETPQYNIWLFLPGAYDAIAPELP